MRTVAEDRTSLRNPFRRFPEYELLVKNYLGATDLVDFCALAGIGKVSSIELTLRTSSCVTGSVNSMSVMSPYFLILTSSPVTLVIHLTFACKPQLLHDSSPIPAKSPDVLNGRF